MSRVDWDAWSHADSLRAVIDPADRTGIKNALIDQIHWLCIARWVRGRRSILDFGCGVGRFTLRLLTTGITYHGADTSQGMIESARERHALTAAAFSHIDRLPLPLPSNSFDSCISVGVMQYLSGTSGDELYCNLAELARTLEPGGELLIIEQASMSGRASGSVSEGVSESRYVAALSEFFQVIEVRRIRCGGMTWLSSVYARHGGFLPFRRAIVARLAERELRFAARADEALLQRLDYYDVCIRAVKTPKPDDAQVRDAELD